MLGALIASCFALAACGGGEELSDDGIEQAQALSRATPIGDRGLPAIGLTSQSTVDAGGLVSFDGWARDNLRVEMVTWTNAAGGSGTAALSGSNSKPNWTVAQVQLKEGDNTLTFVAQDNAGNKSSTTKVVTYTPPAPEPSPDDPETSLSGLPVTVDLLARVAKTSGCTEGYVPGPEVTAAAIPLSASALTHTPAEIAVWRARTASGPFVVPGDYATGSPGDWSRITASASSFLTSGEKTLTQLANDPERYSHGAKARDAAFVYLLTSNTSYLNAVRNHLIAQAGNPLNDFTKLCLRNLNGSIQDAWFKESGWLLRHIVMYDYVRSALSSADRQTIENWIRRNAYFFALQLDKGGTYIFPNRLQGDYTKRSGPAAATTDATKWFKQRVDTNGDCKVDAADNAESYKLALYTRADGSVGPSISILSQYFNNRKATNAIAVGAAGVLFGDIELINRAKRYVLEWLTYSVWPDGSQGEYARNGEYCIPRQGNIYGASNLQGAEIFAEWLARRGDSSLFSFSTRDGLFGTESTGGAKSKSIAMAIGAYLDLITGKSRLYLYEPQKTPQQPRTASSLGRMEVNYNASPKPADDYHELGFLLAANRLPTEMKVAGIVMRESGATSLRFPGSTGNQVTTGLGAQVSAWTDAFNALPSTFLLRP